MKRCEAEERQVVLVQEKNDLALQLQAVSQTQLGANVLQMTKVLHTNSNNHSFSSTKK